MKTWKEILAPVLRNEKMVQLKSTLKKIRSVTHVYPDGKDVFRAFDMCPYESTYVVILGQDPYHTPGVADGLAFSSRASKRPPSLINIFKEVYADLGILQNHGWDFDEFFPTNRLDRWASNGFLLLNTILTVEEGKPLSHKDLGWGYLIAEVFKALNEIGHQVIFLLWGKEAQKFKDLIDLNKGHLIFEASHPAAELYNPGKGGFFGCRHFSIVRDILGYLRDPEIRNDRLATARFDREKVINVANTAYRPEEAGKIIAYLNRGLVYNIPVNMDKYLTETRKFDTEMSTKLN